MNYSEILRTLYSPLAVQAIRAGADALDERPRLLATIAGLEAALDNAHARLRELEPKEQ